LAFHDSGTDPVVGPRDDPARPAALAGYLRDAAATGYVFVPFGTGTAAAGGLFVAGGGPREWSGDELAFLDGTAADLTRALDQVRLDEQQEAAHRLHQHGLPRPARAADQHPELRRGHSRAGRAADRPAAQRARGDQAQHQPAHRDGRRAAHPRPRRVARAAAGRPPDPPCRPGRRRRGDHAAGRGQGRTGAALRGTRRGVGRGRRRPARTGPAESARQRGQVHPARRSGDDLRCGAADRRRAGGGERHRHRHSGGGAREAVRAVPAGPQRDRGRHSRYRPGPGHGTVALESTEGAGTVITLTLPSCPADRRGAPAGRTC